MKNTEGFPMSLCIGIFLLIDAQPWNRQIHSGTALELGTFSTHFRAAGPLGLVIPRNSAFQHLNRLLVKHLASPRVSTQVINPARWDQRQLSC